MATVADIHATFSQNVWPTATRIATIYSGGGNGVYGAWDSDMQFKGPSAPYLKFTLGTAKAKTAWVKSPGIEVEWDGPLELSTASGATHLKVETLNHYAFLPDRPLGEAVYDLSNLPKSGQVIDLQLRDVSDHERPLLASVTFRVQLH